MRKAILALAIVGAGALATPTAAGAASPSACNQGTERAHHTVPHGKKAHQHIPHCM